MAGDPWQTSYDAAERLHRSVLAEVGEAREVKLLNDDKIIPAGRPREVSSQQYWVQPVQSETEDSVRRVEQRGPETPGESGQW